MLKDQICGGKVETFFRAALICSLSDVVRASKTAPQRTSFYILCTFSLIYALLQTTYRPQQPPLFTSPGPSRSTHIPPMALVAYRHLLRSTRIAFRGAYSSPRYLRLH